MNYTYEDMIKINKNIALNITFAFSIIGLVNFILYKYSGNNDTPQEEEKLEETVKETLDNTIKDTITNDTIKINMLLSKKDELISLRNRLLKISSLLDKLKNKF